MSDDPAAVHAAFKTAAANLTQLYVSSLRSTRAARSAGFADAVSEVAQLAERARADGRGGPFAEELLNWCRAKLAEADGAGAQAGNQPAMDTGTGAAHTADPASDPASEDSADQHVHTPPFAFPFPAAPPKRRRPETPTDPGFAPLALLPRGFAFPDGQTPDGKRRRRNGADPRADWAGDLVEWDGEDGDGMAM